MSQNAVRDSMLWTWMYIIVIMFSAIAIAYPQAWHMGIFVIPLCLIFSPLFLILRIRRVKADGNNLSLSGLHDKPKRGQLPRGRALETAAIIAFAFAVCKFMILIF